MNKFKFFIYAIIYIIAILLLAAYFYKEGISII